MHDNSTDMHADPALVSVIIPVYNVQQYLSACLESVLGQTWPHLEVLCVEDGSTDNSLAILEEFERKDSRIRVIRHGRNRGLGVARNSAFAHITGKWVYMLDSDDFISERCIEKLILYAEKYKPDLIQFQARCFNDQTKQYSDSRLFNLPAEDDSDFLFLDSCQQRLKNKPVMYLYHVGPAVFVGNKFLRADFVARFRFYENILFEDLPFHYSIVLNLQTRAFLTDPDAVMYYRTNRTGSIMNEFSTRKNAFVESEKAVNCLEEVFKTYGKQFYLYGLHIAMWTLVYHFIQDRRNPAKRARQSCRKIWSMFAKLPMRKKCAFVGILLDVLRYKLFVYAGMKKRNYIVQFGVYMYILCYLCFWKVLQFLRILPPPNPPPPPRNAYRESL